MVFYSLIIIFFGRKIKLFFHKTVLFMLTYNGFILNELNKFFKNFPQFEFLMVCIWRNKIHINTKIFGVLRFKSVKGLEMKILKSLRPTAVDV